MTASGGILGVIAALTAESAESAGIIQNSTFFCCRIEKLTQLLQKNVHVLGFFYDCLMYLVFVIPLIVVKFIYDCIYCTII